jgi:hypothetical protein
VFFSYKRAVQNQNVALVALFESAVARTPAGQNPVLPIGGQQLAPFIHSDEGIKVLALPGRDVPFIRGRINGRQILYHRYSYIHALLIASRGRVAVHPCGSCQNSWRRPPFPQCIVLPGYWGGCCANCKWPDHAEWCSLHEERRGVRGLVNSDQWLDNVWGSSRLASCAWGFSR